MTCMGLLQAILSGTPVHFDHLAFRTFGVSPAAPFSCSCAPSLTKTLLHMRHASIPLPLSTTVPSSTLPAASLPQDNALLWPLQVPGLGIDSIASVFMDFGYRQQPDELSFAEKKLRARWFAPPNYETNLPRLFISELQVGCHQSAQASA